MRRQRVHGGREERGRRLEHGGRGLGGRRGEYGDRSPVGRQIGSPRRRSFERIWRNACPRVRVVVEVKMNSPLGLVQRMCPPPPMDTSQPSFRALRIQGIMSLQTARVSPSLIAAPVVGRSFQSPVLDDAASAKNWRPLADWMPLRTVAPEVYTRNGGDRRALVCV